MLAGRATTPRTCLDAACATRRRPRWVLDDANSWGGSWWAVKQRSGSYIDEQHLVHWRWGSSRRMRDRGRGGRPERTERTARVQGVNHASRSVDSEIDSLGGFRLSKPSRPRTARASRLACVSPTPSRAVKKACICGDRECKCKTGDCPLEQVSGGESLLPQPRRAAQVVRGAGALYTTSCGRRSCSASGGRCVRVQQGWACRSMK